MADVKLDGVKLDDLFALSAYKKRDTFLALVRSGKLIEKKNIASFAKKIMKQIVGRYHGDLRKCQRKGTNMPVEQFNQYVADVYELMHVGNVINITTWRDPLFVIAICEKMENISHIDFTGMVDRLSRMTTRNTKVYDDMRQMINYIINRGFEGRFSRYSITRALTLDVKLATLMLCNWSNRYADATMNIWIDHIPDSDDGVVFLQTALAKGVTPHLVESVKSYPKDTTLTKALRLGKNRLAAVLLDAGVDASIIVDGYSAVFYYKGDDRAFRWRLAGLDISKPMFVDTDDDTVMKITNISRPSLTLTLPPSEPTRPILTCTIHKLSASGETICDGFISALKYKEIELQIGSDQTTKRFYKIK